MRTITALTLAALMLAGVVAGSGPGSVAAQGLPTEPQGGMETREFRDWTLRCLETDGQRRCEMIQAVDDPADGEPVLAMVVTRQPGGAPPLAWIVLPLGLLLPPGVGLRIDQGETQRLPVRHCEPGGCLVPWELDAAALTALRGGVTLEVLAYDIDEEAVAIPVSLLGFTAALEALPR